MKARIVLTKNTCAECLLLESCPNVYMLTTKKADLFVCVLQQPLPCSHPSQLYYKRYLVKQTKTFQKVQRLEQKHN